MKKKQSVSCNQQWRPRRTTAYRTYTAIGPPTHLLCHGQKRDYLSRASQRARDATNYRLDVRFRPHFYHLINMHSHIHTHTHLALLGELFSL